MNTKTLKHKKQIVQTDQKKACIYYYVTRDSALINETLPAYGIEIEKKHEDIVVDNYSVCDCFYSEDEAEDLLKTLADYTVTPVCAEEVIEEILNDI